MGGCAYSGNGGRHSLPAASDHDSLKVGAASPEEKELVERGGGKPVKRNISLRSMKPFK